MSSDSATDTLRARVEELQRENATLRSNNDDWHRRFDDVTAALQLRVTELAQAKDEIAGLYNDAQQHVVQLQELDQLKSQFLSMASHELKTPLTSISGFLQLVTRRLRRRESQGMPAEDDWSRELRSVLEQLEVITRQTAKLGRLIDELLDVSRIQSNRVEFSFAPLDLAELAKEAAGRIQLTTMAHQIQVESEPADLTITADRDHVEQVLNNLLTNAIKYSPAGGPIAIGLRAHTAQVQLSVSDRGVGIPADQLNAVFGLFYRAPEQDSRRLGGLGLGLYISKEIVARHGGRIWVESAPDQGSTFFVELPRVPTTVADSTGSEGTSGG